jgi:hypothetical protein
LPIPISRKSIPCILATQTIVANIRPKLEHNGLKSDSDAVLIELRTEA